MKFCKECGSSLKEGVEFCSECGTPVNGKPAENATQQQSHTTPNKAPKQNPLKTMSKKTKIMIGSALIAVVVLFIGYKIGDSLTSKEHLIEKFEEALNAKDERQIAGLLSSNDKAVEIDKESIQGLMTYLDKNPEKVREIIKSLEAQAKMIDKLEKAKDKDIDSLNGMDFSDFIFSNSSTNNGIVNLEKDGKTFIYDNYDLNIESIYLTIYTNYKDTELLVNGKKVGKADKQDFEKTYGPYLPGTYDIEAELKTDFVELKNKQTINLVNVGNKRQVDMYLDGEEIEVDVPNGVNGGTAKLFINGADTGVNLYENNTFGPIVTDGSITMHTEIEVPWGVVKTDEIPIENRYLDVDLMTEDLKNQLMDIAVLAAEEWGHAYTSADVSKLTTYTEDMVKEYQDDIDDAKEDEAGYQGKFLGATFDLDSFKVYRSNDNWYARFSGNEKYYSDSFYGDDQPELEEDDNYWTYTCIYDADQKKWLIADQNSSWGFNDDNVKEVQNADAKMYTTTWKKPSTEKENEE